MELPIDIIIRVDAKKENDSGEYTFQCKALGELVRCGECKYYEKFNSWCAYCKKVDSYISNENWFCADGERKDGKENGN